MLKRFYVSGFLYHPPTQKILLQQEQEAQEKAPAWRLLGDFCQNEKIINDAFKKIVFQVLKIKIKLIYPVYSYVQSETKVNHFLVYAKTQKLLNFLPGKKIKFEWFTFKQVSTKLKLTEQDKHDLTVGQRVVDAATRKRLGLRTL